MPIEQGNKEESASKWCYEIAEWSMKIPLKLRLRYENTNRRGIDQGKKRWKMNEIASKSSWWKKITALDANDKGKYLIDQGIEC